MRNGVHKDMAKEGLTAAVSAYKSMLPHMNIKKKSIGITDMDSCFNKHVKGL
jgi:hypothetical protein